MNDLVGIAVLAGICWYCFRHGKSLGCRKGFQAGRRRRKRRL
ncbi:hypothetical protein [Rubinisphaera italica]|nr:hypothetical protein [Rubinisphaera italica]